VNVEIRSPFTLGRRRSPRLRSVSRHLDRLHLAGLEAELRGKGRPFGRLGAIRAGRMQSADKAQGWQEQVGWLLLVAGSSVRSRSASTALRRRLLFAVRASQHVRQQSDRREDLIETADLRLRF
jgi:hypothetical protein